MQQESAENKLSSFGRGLNLNAITVRYKQVFIAGFVLMIGVLFFTSCSDGEKQDVPIDTDQISTKQEDTLGPLQQLNQKISSSPTAGLFNERALLLLERNDVEGAFEDVKRAIALDSTKGEFWYSGAFVLRQNLQIPISMEYAKRAEAKGLATEKLFLLMSEEYLILMQYQEAISYANKALKENVASYQAYYYKGMVYEETKDVKRAISSYQTALEQSNKFPDAYNNLIKLYTAKEDYKMATEYVNSGLRFLPNDPFIHYNYGILVEKQGLLDSALYIYEKGEALDSTFDLMKYKIAHICNLLNKKDQASLYYEKVIRMNPTFELVYSEWGMMLIKQDRELKAQEILRRGLLQFPDSKEIQKLYNQVK